MSQTLYILCGLGFSGKSTLAKKISESKNAVLVSQDAIYFEKEKELYPNLDDEEGWELIRKIAFERVAENLKEGKSVVYDDTNTRYEHRDALRKIALENNTESTVVFVDTPEAILVERQIKNKETKERHDVEQKYLNQAKAELEIPQSDENVFIFTPETNLEEWLSKLI